MTARNAPAPREGLAEIRDGLVGPGVNRAESRSTLAFAAGAAAVTAPYTVFGGPDRGLARISVAGLPAAFDLTGGAVAGFGLVPVHGVHILAVVWPLRPTNRAYSGAAYDYLVAAPPVVLRSPPRPSSSRSCATRRRRRPIAETRRRNVREIPPISPLTSARVAGTIRSDDFTEHSEDKAGG